MVLCIMIDLGAGSHGLLAFMDSNGSGRYKDSFAFTFADMAWA
jgi:hypothetical protein